MQAVEQPKKSKLWALLSGILGISWGLLFVVVPFCFLPQTFWGVMFILFFSFTPNVKEFAEVLQGAYTALAIISIVVWILLIISIYAKRYYRGDRLVPFLRNTIYQLQITGVLKLPVFFMFTGSAILSVISGIGYLISLKNFRKKRHE